MKPLNPGQARVLHFLQQNADDDGHYYCRLRDLADAVSLSPSYVRQVTIQLARLGIIAFEKMWELDGTESESTPRLIPARMAPVFGIGPNYCYSPGGNLYRILHPERVDELLNTSCTTVIMSTCEDSQLTLPFSPFEKTILATGARFTSEIQPVTQDQKQ